MHGAPREDLDGLLVRRAHKGTRVNLGDPVARDRHQVAAERHDVAQQREVPVVEVRHAAAGEDDAELHEERCAHRLDAEDGKDLGHVVRDRAGRVDARVGEDGLEVRAVRFQNPLAFASDAPKAVLVRPLLDDILAREDAANVPHPRQLHLCQEIVLHVLQELVLSPSFLFVVVVLLLECPLVALRGLREKFRSVLEPNPQHQPLRVVVTSHDQESPLEARVDLVPNLLHLDFVVSHLLRVKLDAQEPRRHVSKVNLFVRHVKVARNKLAVFRNNRLHVRGRIVPDLRLQQGERERASKRCGGERAGGRDG